METNSLLIFQSTKNTESTGSTGRKDEKRQFARCVAIGLNTLMRCHPDVESRETEGSAVAFPCKKRIERYFRKAGDSPLRQKLPVCAIEKGAIAANLSPCETEAEKKESDVERRTPFPVLHIPPVG